MSDTPPQVGWRKASASNGCNHCVEVCWRKAKASHGNGACVEVAEHDAEVLMRDSKHPEQGHLTFTSSEFAALVAAARAGELDDLAGVS